MGDINRADHIYGESTPIIKGKMSINKPTVHLKLINAFTSSNIRETEKPAPLHGPFLRKLLDILTHSDRKNQFPLIKITDIKRSNIIHQIT